MRLLGPLTYLHAYFRILLGVSLLAVLPLSAGAQSIEAVISPGVLIKDHAKFDEDCKQCHVRFDRKAQDGRCMDCHKEVGADVRGKTGYHGRMKPQACRSCHTDHKGRDVRIAEFDKDRFDHSQTDFTLRGKHADVDCGKCHAAGKKYREAAPGCNDCHRKDDVHKGSLGPKCADCHTEKNWKEARFDHDKTRFALKDKHADVKCADCHKDNRFKDTPLACSACHKKDDDKNGHKGQFGEKCESCHTARSWKENTFNHDTDTKYVLRGKHIKATCTSCHTGHLYKLKLSPDCYACHKKDDKHKESLGKNCGSCHTERDWKEKAKFDHDKTDFPLLGKHTRVECKDCHQSVMFKEAPKDCYSCHKKDDKHEHTLGQQCADCHTEKDWKDTTGRFDHDKTKFQLRNAHAASSVRCTACHKDLRSMRKTPLDCYSCHKKDDKHEGQEGMKCESCHNDRSWKDTRFDHGQSRFPLTGKHVVTSCKKCHETARYKDAPRDCYGCHRKDDKHKLKFGVKCESCHNTRSWDLWSYDHNARTSFRLDGAHRKVACETCHKEPAPRGKDTAVLGSSCVGCHRNEDVHDGQFGARCEQCHATDNWKNFRNRVGSRGQAAGEETLVSQARTTRGRAP